MSINKYLLTLLLGSFLLGCNVNGDGGEHEKTESHEHHHDEKSNDLTKELMAIHDSIMPATERLMDLKQKIAADIKITDSLNVIKSSATLQKRKEQALDLTIQLDKADKEMMGWMHQYKGDTLAKLDQKQAAEYVAAQKQKIEAVRDLMEKSIGEAQLFIQKKESL